MIPADGPGPEGKGNDERLLSMEYPHWLMVAGAVLLVLGFIGMALRQSVAQDEFKEMATGAEEERSESEAELAQTPAKMGKNGLPSREPRDGIGKTAELRNR
jgi:hypothetical protein